MGSCSFLGGGCPKKSASSNQHDVHLSKNRTRREEISITVKKESLFLLSLLLSVTFNFLPERKGTDSHTQEVEGCLHPF